MKKGVKTFIISMSALHATIVSIVITLIIAAVILIVYLTFCFTEYGDKNIEKDGLVYELSNYKKECMVYPKDLYFNSDDEMIIDIPDEINGYKVTELGGYLGRGYPCPFSVRAPLEYEIEYSYRGSASKLPDNSEIIKYRVTINLGSNIRKVYCTLTPDSYYKVLSSDTYIQMIAYFNCPEDNKYFYSVDGVLYNKSDDTPVIENFIMY